MLGVALPILLGISRGTGPFGMTPWLSLTSSVYGKSGAIIISRTTALTVKFIVTKPSGKEFAFQESVGGLHYLGTTCPQDEQ